MRTSWLFGPGGKNFISSIFKWLHEKEELKVVSDQCGRPTYCQDLAEAILGLLTFEGVVHFSNSGEGSRYQIALEIWKMAQEMGLPIKCQRIDPVLSQAFPTPAPRPAFSVLDTQKYTFLTNQRPRSWSEAICEFIPHAKTV